ncbi:MAG: hypothetical protein U0837_11910 [Dehalococcoidia bacterium]|jgi:hypothetical protein
MTDSYDRKISSEEAAEGYIMVLKDRLKFFPPAGEPFSLDGAPASVEARHCECRGPEKPHDHYFIRRAGLAKGQRVSIGRNGTDYTFSAD